MVAQVRQRVADHDLGARIVEGALVHLGQVLAAEVDQLAVDVHHHRALDTRVAQHLAQRGALAAAGDQDALRRRVGDQRGVDQRLVVDVLVGDGRLRRAVQEQRPPERPRLDDLDVLERRLAPGRAPA